MTFLPPNNLYSANTGTSQGLGAIHYDVRAPAVNDFQGYSIGQQWVWPNNGIWELLGISTAAAVTTANWVQLASSSGDILAVTGTSPISVTTTAGTAAVSIVSSPSFGGNTTSATGFTATSGNFTATTGNLVLNGVASGIVTTPTVVAAGASPQVANGRVFVVTFSGVSIASGASQTLVITNSSITGSTTDISLTWSGATAGSALSIASVTPSAGSLSIVMTNGTSATMVTSVANITFTGIVLN
jgi:hypothetical protein